MSSPTNAPGDRSTTENSDTIMRLATNQPTAAPSSARRVRIRTPSTRREATTSGQSMRT
jgi:hypothetical protein